MLSYLLVLPFLSHKFHLFYRCYSYNIYRYFSSQHVFFVTVTASSFQNLDTFLVRSRPGNQTTFCKCPISLNILYLFVDISFYFFRAVFCAFVTCNPFIFILVATVFSLRKYVKSRVELKRIIWHHEKPLT